ncbi:MAG: hypothetical protein EXR93_11690 [Gemmatimonadetes bacterium]|nr:hypothetical protein [Gemmatimonadota bacterium]
MIELLVVMLVLGASMVVFYPVLAGRDFRAAGPARTAGNRSVDPETEEQVTDLREQKRRVLRNLQELEKERAAGRIADTDYAVLRDRDTVQAARIIEQLDKIEAELKAGRRPSKKAPAVKAQVPPRQRAARVLAWVGGITAFGAVLVFTMSQAITDREPGGTITGTIPGGPGDGGPAGGGGAAFMPAADPARLQALERTLRGDSANLKALLEAGHLYLAERRLDEAASVTLRALRMDSVAPEAHAHMGVLLMAAGIPDTALMAENTALRLKPDLAEAWLFKGMIYMAGLQDPKSAAAAWEHYLQVAPKGADTSRIAAIVRGMKNR